MSGCAGEASPSDEARRKQPTIESTSPTDAARQSPAVLRDARTAADQKNQTCSAPTLGSVTESWYDPVIVADGDLTIGEVHAVGDGVELVDAEGLVVVGNPHDVGRGTNSEWPWPEDRMLEKVDPASRTELVGMAVRDGQNVLPLLRLRFEPDSHLRGLSIEYEGDTGNHDTLFVPMDSTHARPANGCD